MDIFDGRYYFFIKEFMKLTGLWPHDISAKRRSYHLAYYVTNISVLIPVAVVVINFWAKDLQLMIEGTIGVLFFVGILMKYSVTYINAPRLKSLMSQVQKDWEKITEKDELDILYHHYDLGRWFCIFWIGYYLGGWMVLAGTPFIPLVLDHIVPLKNGTYGKIIIVRAEYLFFDYDEYYYVASCHLSSVILIDMLMVCGQDTMYYMCIMHTRGLFDVLSHRVRSKINHLLNEDKHSSDSKGEKLMSYLKECVIMHNETIRNCVLIEEMYSICNMVIIFLFAIQMPIILFMSLYIVDVSRALQWTPCSVGALIYMGFNFWLGQQIIDYSEAVYESAYFSNWLSFLPEQRVYIGMMIHRSQRCCQLTLGKITVISMESYKKMISTAGSYFTILQSVVSFHE